MGWYYTYGADKAAIVREIESDTKRSFVIRERALRGNHLWHVVSPVDGGETFIALYLLQSRKEGWGYKPMEEAMEPYYYTCPTTWFGKYPTANAAALKWRERCRTAAFAKAAKIKAAKTVAVGDLLYRKCDGEVFRVIGPNGPRKGEFIIEGKNSGKRYRAKRTFIAEYRISQEQAQTVASVQPGTGLAPPACAP